MVLCWIFGRVAGQGWASSTRWHHRGQITPPSSTHHRAHSPDSHAHTHTHIHAHTQTHTEFRLSHGSLLGTQSGCCQSELNLLSLVAFLLTLPASGWVFNILFRIPALPPHGYIGWTRRLSAARQISKWPEHTHRTGHRVGSRHR